MDDEMNTRKQQLDAARTAVAFARAFGDGDPVGALGVWMQVPDDEKLDLACALAMIVKHAREVAKLSPGPFFESYIEWVDHQQVPPPGKGQPEA
jgi:hypothetical protein